MILYTSLRTYEAYLRCYDIHNKKIVNKNGGLFKKIKKLIRIC